ncbi:hypothetical protein LguiA_030056 [Lonicera macranthoides]
MKLFKISSLILLIIILFAGYFFPYVAPNRGYKIPCAPPQGPVTLSRGPPPYRVYGSKPPRGGIP